MDNDNQRLKTCSAWSDLPSELLERVATHLTENEVTCTLRLLNKAAAQHVKGWTTVRLSQPVPQHAFAWRWGRPDSTRDMTLRQRHRLLALTARSGVLANLQVAFTAAGCILVGHGFVLAFAEAAAGGSLNVCKWLLDMRCSIHDGWSLEPVLESAGRAGNFEVVRWLLQQQTIVVDDEYTDQFALAAFKAAASAGQRALCDRLLDDGMELLEEALAASLRSGQVALMERLLELVQPATGEGDDMITTRLADAAMGLELSSLQRFCHLFLGSRPLGNIEDKAMVMAGAITSLTSDWREKVEWLEQQGFSLSLEGERAELACHLLDDGYGRIRIDETFRYIFMERPDAVERVQFLHQRGVLVTEDYEELVFSAVHAPNVPVVQYIRAHNLLVGRRPQNGVAAAASMGDLTLLSEMKSLGVDLAGAGVKVAARYGHLNLLQWMDEAALLAAQRRLTNYAAESGSMEVMRWVRERRCPWAKDTLKWAAFSGNVDFLEMLVAEGCPMKDDAPFEMAAARGDLATLACLRRLGCPWDPNGATFGKIIKTCNSLELLGWLVTEGYLVDWQLAREAARQRIKRQSGWPDGAGEVLSWVESQMRAAGILHSR